MSRKEDLRKALAAPIAALPAKSREEVRKSLGLLQARTGASSAYDLEPLLRHRDADIQARACLLLGMLRDERSARSLVRTISDSRHKVVIWEAAKGLVSIGAAVPVKRVMEALLKGRSTENRSAAAWVLGNLGARQAVGALRRVLLDEAQSPDVRGHAAEALGGLMDKRAVPALIASLSDKSATVRFWVCYALGQIRDKRAVRHLQRIVGTDKGAVRGWGRISDEAADAMKRLEA